MLVLLVAFFARELLLQGLICSLSSLTLQIQHEVCLQCVGMAAFSGVSRAWGGMGFGFGWAEGFINSVF